MTDKQKTAPVRQHRNGPKMRGMQPPRTPIVPHRPADCKTRAAMTATAALALLACVCLAECLAGSGWWYMIPAGAAALAANACAGAVVGSMREEARHD